MSCVDPAKLQVGQCHSSAGEWTMYEWMAVMFADRCLMFLDWMMIVQLTLLDSDETLTTAPTNATEHDQQTIPGLPQCKPTILTNPSTSHLIQHSSHPISTLMITCISLQTYIYPYSINPLSLNWHLSHPSHHLAPSTLYIRVTQQ